VMEESNRFEGGWREPAGFPYALRFQGRGRGIFSPATEAYDWENRSAEAAGRIVAGVPSLRPHAAGPARRRCPSPRSGMKPAGWANLGYGGGLAGMPSGSGPVLPNPKAGLCALPSWARHCQFGGLHPASTSVVDWDRCFPSTRRRTMWIIADSG